MEKKDDLKKKLREKKRMMREARTGVVEIRDEDPREKKKPRTMDEAESKDYTVDLVVDQFKSLSKSKKRGKEQVQQAIDIFKTLSAMPEELRDSILEHPTMVELKVHDFISQYLPQIDPALGQFFKTKREEKKKARQKLKKQRTKQRKKEAQEKKSGDDDSLFDIPEPECDDDDDTPLK